MNFSQTEKAVESLRQELASGAISEAQLKARLKELMVQDERGDWWMIGYETGQWYRHDGEAWVRDNPPGYAKPARAESEPRGTYRLNFWRGLGLSGLGTLVYKILAGGASALTRDIPPLMVGITIWPFEFIPPLVSVLFGPWVGGGMAALSYVVSLIILGLSGGAYQDQLLPRDWLWTLVCLSAEGVLIGLAVKNAKNWKAVIMVFVLARCLSSLAILVYEFLVLDYSKFFGWEYLGGQLAERLVGGIPLTIVILPIAAYYLVDPVRRAGLYWQERPRKGAK